MDGQGADQGTGTAMPSYSQLFRVRAFVAIFASSTLSAWGDQLARLTVAAFVLERSGSPLAAATTLAVSLIPSLFGRSLLGPIADRFPYRNVLIAANVVRAALVGVIIVAVAGGWSLAWLLTLLFVLELAGGPAVTSMRILLTDLFEDRRLFTRALGLNGLSEQVNQVIGLGVGGVIVFAVGATNALWFDLATFLISALVVALAIAHRPVLGTPSAGLVGYFHDIVAGGRYLARHRVLAAMLTLSLATSWAIAAPEAVALAYAAESGGARYGGLLMAAPMAGAVLGLVVIGRWQPHQQNARIITLALSMPVPLLATAFQPPLLVTGLLWFLSGALQAFMLPLQATFSLMVTPEMRGRVFGLAGALTVSATGVAFLVSGLLAQQLTAAAAVSVAAVFSLAAIVLLAARWPRRALARAVTDVYDC
jgi:MFS family permease